MRGVVSEALASRKVVYREVCTEGSEPAKSGTDTSTALSINQAETEYEAYLFG